MDSAPDSGKLEIFDSHAHLYSSSVIASVRNREGLAASLHLDLEAAAHRIDKSALQQECRTARVNACLLLPTAPAHKVVEINNLFISIAKEEDGLFTAGTLHPLAPGQDKELDRLSRLGIRALKLCSFSQGFDLDAPETLRFFNLIRDHNIERDRAFYVVLDTFYQADAYFGAPRNFVTTPQKLGRLASTFPEINFVGAHMGGLAAPFSEIEHHLPPRNNFYLDTSNAARLLSRDEFLRLVHLHGPDHVLFGTDWPWFGHTEEVGHIRELLQIGGFSSQEQTSVFSRNVCRLLGIFR